MAASKPTDMSLQCSPTTSVGRAWP